MNLPSRDRASDDRFLSASLSLHDENEMDVSPDASVDQPSPSTSNSQSRGGSGSHSSYSPGNQQGDIQNMAFRNSPKGMAGQMPLPHTTSANANANFFSSSEDMFPVPSLYNPPGIINGDALSNGIMMGNEWDMAGMGQGTGMTPMSEGSWNQMLESINLGWGSVGPPHGSEVFGNGR